MKKLLLALVVLTLPPAVFAETARVLVLGDSLSAGYGVPLGKDWVSLLQQRLQEQGYPYSVLNASISGDTTAGGLTRLPPLLIEHRPAVLLIELGANDGLRGFGFEQVHSNLQHLIRLGLRADAQVLLVGVRLPPNYGVAYTESFQALFSQLAREEQVPLVPLLLAGVAQNRDLMQADGLHPKAEAQPRILENVWPHLEPLLNKPRDSGE